MVGGYLNSDDESCCYLINSFADMIIVACAIVVAKLG